MVWKRDFVLFLFLSFTFSSFVHTPHVQLYLSLRTLGSQSFIILKVLSVFSPWSVHHLPGLGIDKSCLVETGKRLEIHHRLLDLSSKSCFCLQGCGALFTLHVPIPGQNGDNDSDKKKRFLTSSSRWGPSPPLPSPGTPGQSPTQARRTSSFRNQSLYFNNPIPFPIFRYRFICYFVFYVRPIQLNINTVRPSIKWTGLQCKPTPVCLTVQPQLGHPSDWLLKLFEASLKETLVSRASQAFETQLLGFHSWKLLTVEGKPPDMDGKQFQLLPTPVWVPGNPTIELFAFVHVLFGSFW